MDDDIVSKAEKAVEQGIIDSTAEADKIVVDAIICWFSDAINRIRDVFKQLFESLNRAIKSALEQFEQFNIAFAVPKNHYDYRRNPFNGKRIDYRAATNHYYSNAD